MCLRIFLENALRAISCTNAVRSRRARARLQIACIGRWRGASLQCTLRRNKEVTLPQDFLLRRSRTRRAANAIEQTQLQAEP
jgi:hypothetical protein